MSVLKSLHYLGVSLLLLSCSTVVACGEEPEWQVMFNGKDFDGWQINEAPDSWRIEDRMIVSNGPRSHLFFQSKEPFKNFHFKARVKTTKGSNAGIYFHTKFQEQGWPRFGYECQVNVSHKDKKKSGGLYSVKDVFDPPIEDDKWYTQEIIVKGKNIKLIINGETLVDYTEPKDKKPFDKNFERRLGEGTIALQAHDKDSLVYFKDLMIKRFP